MPCAAAGSATAVTRSASKANARRLTSILLRRAGAQREARGRLVAAHRRAAEVQVVALEGLLEKARGRLVTADHGVLQPNPLEDVGERRDSARAVLQHLDAMPPVARLDRLAPLAGRQGEGGVGEALAVAGGE